MFIMVAMASIITIIICCCDVPGFIIPIIAVSGLLTSTCQWPVFATLGLPNKSHDRRKFLTFMTSGNDAPFTVAPFFGQRIETLGLPVLMPWSGGRGLARRELDLTCTF